MLDYAVMRSIEKHGSLFCSYVYMQRPALGNGIVSNALSCSVPYLCSGCVLGARQVELCHLSGHEMST